MNTNEQQKSSETTQDVVYLTYDKASSAVITSELEKAGYRIKFTSSIGETILCLRESKYAALIVGLLVQPNDKTLLASELRRRNSQTKTVFLSRDGTQRWTETQARPDAVLNIQNGAEGLIRTLEKLLGSNR